jgi:hypothetical protein
MVVVIGEPQTSSGLLGTILLVGTSVLVYGARLFILKGFKMEETAFSEVCSGLDPMYFACRAIGVYN